MVYYLMRVLFVYSGMNPKDSYMDAWKLDKKTVKKKEENMKLQMKPVAKPVAPAWPPVQPAGEPVRRNKSRQGVLQDIPVATGRTGRRRTTRRPNRSDRFRRRSNRRPNRSAGFAAENACLRTESGFDALEYSVYLPPWPLGLYIGPPILIVSSDMN